MTRRFPLSKDEKIKSLQIQLKQANECAASWICKYQADSNLFQKQNKELAAKDAEIKELKQERRRLYAIHQEQCARSSEYLNENIRLKKALQAAQKALEEGKYGAYFIAADLIDSCQVTGDDCVFMRPDSKACAAMFNEGPDASEEEDESDVRQET
ncbi:hypothetical protein EJP82_00985 [Paenibacillus anaericanus]|uniref:Uncharacterized protein n=1 Tax=Paenibacillus anaericanus TaxID=170367 RepID=A0A433YF95_9BACL|nr:hypothetical protein [Paenibacillus anaericanus]RUT48549.1 hypothetical protein EJP82_00985 [Paenibacillus anaericanus]